MDQNSVSFGNYFFCLLLFIGATLLSLKGNAQIKEVYAQDYVPDTLFTQVLNYPPGSLKISDFKGKTVILDFGAINCHGCLKMLHRLDSLQALFPGQVQVIWVTQDARCKVDTFLKTDNIGKKITCAVIANDTLLSAYFVHYGTPHEVWIDRQGLVEMISSPKFINREQIDLFLRVFSPRGGSMGSTSSKGGTN